MDDIISYYKKQGAPGDQNALVSMFREIQQECGGVISPEALSQAAQSLNVKESFLLAVIKRIPSLKIDNRHKLEICGGPNCSKCREISAYAEKLPKSDKLNVSFSPCMRMCGKGPNVKLDGTVYHHADVALLKKLTEPYL